MTPLRYTLLADGPSDRCLLRIIDWLLASLPSVSPRVIAAQFADPRQLRNQPMAEKMRQAIHYYPCDVFFVHRDAEREPVQNRLKEISLAAEQAQIRDHVPVIPVRMTEAWLLLEVDAIRRAADNPNGNAPITLPRLHDLESEPDPKQLLFSLLLIASEKTGRRLDRFRRDLAWRRARVADFTSDFSALLQLPAFAHFAAETKRVVEAWCESHP